MELDNIKSDEYDFVYTSNGVHVWINDLHSMYENIHRIMKKDGIYIMYEIHPFLRPFNGKALDRLEVIKPYDSTGPFESGEEITFTWRIQDIMNAQLNSGLSLCHIEEMYAEKEEEDTFWISYADKQKGVTATQEAINRMFDYKVNPQAALPNWICISARK